MVDLKFVEWIKIICSNFIWKKTQIGLEKIILIQLK